MADVILTLDDVRAAAERLSGVAHRTPVVTSRTLDERTGATVFLKAENLQRGGAFKFRGAYTMISSLGPEQRAAGVVAYSSGNHAQAVSLAARIVGTSATILMPADTPAAKLDATRGYGAEVVTYDRYTEDREALGAALAEERGLVLVPPYEHPLIMAGQGTSALELLEEAPDLDVLLVPVGGGGLIAGCATAAKAIRPGIRVIGVEPEAGDDTRRSLEAGERVRIPVPRTIADGQQADIPGELTFAVNRHVVDTDRHRIGLRDRRRDGVPVRPHEARDGAERRQRGGRASRRPRPPSRRGPRRRDHLGRERRRCPLRRADGAVARCRLTPARSSTWSRSGRSEPRSRWPLRRWSSSPFRCAAARRIAVVGIGLTALAAAGLWVWLLSEADRYDDGSRHLDHVSSSNLVLAAAGGAVAIALGLAALRRPSRRLLAAALAVSALACLAQTYGFLGYTTSG